MSIAATAATAHRVLLQLRRDPRALALLVAVPCGAVVLLRAAYGGRPTAYVRVAGPLLAVVPFTTMVVVAVVTTLRPHASGALERLLTLPMRRFELVAGHALGLGLVGIAPALAITALTIGPAGVRTGAGSPWLVAIVALLAGLLGTAVGLLVSAVAATPGAAAQLVLAVVVPQIVLCGLLVQRTSVVAPLRFVADALPLSWAVDAAVRVLGGQAGVGTALAGPDIAGVLAATGGALALGALALRPRPARAHPAGRRSVP